MELRYQAENALRDGMVINQHKARYVLSLSTYEINSFLFAYSF